MHTENLQLQEGCICNDIGLTYNHPHIKYELEHTLKTIPVFLLYIDKNKIMFETDLKC